MPAVDESRSDPPPSETSKRRPHHSPRDRRRPPAAVAFWRKDDTLDGGVDLSWRAVVASFAGAALGWRLETAVRVVVVEQRVGRVVELACLVVGEPSGAAVGRVREDRHTVAVADGSWARRLSGVGLFLGGHRRTVALSLFEVDRGRLLGDRLLLAGRGRRPVGLRDGAAITRRQRAAARVRASRARRGDVWRPVQLRREGSAGGRACCSHPTCGASESHPGGRPPNALRPAGGLARRGRRSVR
jgi:hypothetical protein